MKKNNDQMLATFGKQEILAALRAPHLTHDINKL